MTAVRALPPSARTREAHLLLDPLLSWLRQTGRLRRETDLFLEFAWAGRRVDIVTVGKRLRTSAFELKLGSTGRALEQAIYNRGAFDRTFMVVAHTPRPSVLSDACSAGVGVLLVDGMRVRQLVQSPIQRPGASVRQRLLASLQVASPWETHR